MYPPPDPNETILEKIRKKPRLLIVWPALLLLCLSAGVFVLALNFSDRPESGPLMAGAVVAAIFAIGVLIVVSVVRWLVRKHLRATLIALTSLVVLVSLFYLEEDWRGRRDWKNFEQQQEAKGEKFDFASFVPPAVPDDQNFAMTPIVASSYAFMLDKNGHQLMTYKNSIVNRLAMRVDFGSGWNVPIGDWAVGTVTDLRPWQTYYQRANILTNRPGLIATNEGASPQAAATDVLLALQRYDSDIEELRQAAALPYSRFPLQYDNDDPSSILLPHLSALSSAAKLLQLRAIAELQLGQSEKAAADIKLILRLVAASQSEPFLVSALGRIFQVNFARQTIYEGLANHQFSDTQLAALDLPLAQLDFLADYQRTMRSQAAYIPRMVDYFQRTHNLGVIPRAFGGGPNPLIQKIIDTACAIVPAGWFQENKVSFSKFYLEECLPLVDMEHRKVSPAAADRAETKVLNEMHYPGPYNVLQGLILQATGGMLGNNYIPVEKFVYAQECVDLTRVAIALERYRLAHGQYPSTLDALAPQFLAKVPHDIIGGGNLKYRITGQNFILYSIGWNGIDDGGLRNPMKDTQPVWTRGDWVWQYP